ncbi:hypothetical protein AR457_37205 [Streptomyces agglomeratus]|nr:hypothetical protein AR457_37205 [Streptomyces agglomeratus]
MLQVAHSSGRGEWTPTRLAAQWRRMPLSLWLLLRSRGSFRLLLTLLRLRRSPLRNLGGSLWSG